MEEKQKLIYLLGCPICHSRLSFNDKLVKCDNCNIAFTKNEKGVISFLCEKMYSSREDFDKATKVVEYWGNGWKKRLKEPDHNFLFEGEKEDIYKYIDIKMIGYRERRNVGGLFSTEVDFAALKDKTCLNIGCGAGTEALILVRQGGAHCIAMDITLPAAEAARSLIEKTTGVGIGIQADARFIPLQDNSIDFVYSSGVLHHSENIDKSINEVYRVLKPGGIAYIGLYSNTSLHFLYVQTKGILQGCFTGKDRLKYLSNNTEVDWGTQNGKNPLTKTFGKRDCERLFSKFRNLSIRKGSFYWEQIPKIGKFIGKFRQKKIVSKLENIKTLAFCGMGICVKAEK